MVQSWITRILGRDGKKKARGELELTLSNSEEDKMYELRRHGKKYKIYEEKTAQYIATFKDKDEAVNYLYKLNGGTGFKGETPVFFLNGEKNGIDFSKPPVDPESF